MKKLLLWVLWGLAAETYGMLPPEEQHEAIAYEEAKAFSQSFVLGFACGAATTCAEFYDNKHPAVPFLRLTTLGAIALPFLVAREHGITRGCGTGLGVMAGLFATLSLDTLVCQNLTGMDPEEAKLWVCRCLHPEK